MFIVTMKQASPFAPHSHRLRRKSSEAGAVAIMTPFFIILMLAMFGMALDLARSYNRIAELQTAADAAALIAAATLDGTQAGIDRAVTEAGVTAEYSAFGYSTASVAWSSAALKFGRTPDGGPSDWMDAETAKAHASQIFYARVDTMALDAKHGAMQNIFMPILSSTLKYTTVATSAVAGRGSVNVLPLAICANNNTPAASLSSGELVEYGFRRGVTYNLMNLNPGGRSPENFLINPVAPPGTTGTTMTNRLDVVAPFICTGKMAIPTLQGGGVTVERGFPINKLYVHLNSRFGSYAAPCQPATAPADPVTKTFDLANVTWMKFAPDKFSANPLDDPDPLLTVAEKPAGATKSAYGPLWTYAKAARYSSYVAKGGVEPVGGYSTFNTTDWNVLYTPGLPQAKPSYPSTTPYQDAGGSATYKSLRDTRVLRVPLLRCPVSTQSISTASVLGIAKFFMMTPATSSEIYAEFAGMDAETVSGSDVRLYR